MFRNYASSQRHLDLLAAGKRCKRIVVHACQRAPLDYAMSFLIRFIVLKVNLKESRRRLLPGQLERADAN